MLNSADERYDRREGPILSLVDVADVGRHFFGTRPPERIALLSGGFSNANYLVDFGTERFVLRFFLGGPAVGEREAAVLRAAARNGISVPPVIAYEQVAGHAICVLGFVEGQLLSDVLRARPADGETLLFQVGTELARIHGVKYPTAGLFGGSGQVTLEFPDFCEGARHFLLDPLEGVAGTRLGPELVAGVRAAANRHWHAVAATFAGASLVHCDFNPKNLLISGGKDRRVTSVLDWEFAMAAHPAIDFGNFLRFEGEDYPVGAREAFVRGYCAGGGVLPCSWERAARLLDLTSMVDFLNRPIESPKTFRTARAVIARTLDDMAAWSSRPERSRAAAEVASADAEAPTPWPALSDLTPASAARFIDAQVELTRSPDLEGSRHGKRWIGVDGRYVYLIPGDQEESTRLQLEQSIIEGLHAGYCPVPEIVHSSPALQVRTMITGTTLYDGERLVFGTPTPPANRYDRALPITRQGETLALSLAGAIAVCHLTFEGREESLERAGLRRFRFDGQDLVERLAPFLDAGQLASLKVILARYERHASPIVVCHGDLNHHNFCSDRATGALVGIFDFGDCCLGPRELDFKFLLSNGQQFLDICVERYEHLTRVTLDRRSILDHHILEAAANWSYALRHPHHGIERCCGWLTSALSALA